MSMRHAMTIGRATVVPRIVHHRDVVLLRFYTYEKPSTLPTTIGPQNNNAEKTIKFHQTGYVTPAHITL